LLVSPKGQAEVGHGFTSSGRPLAFFAGWLHGLLSGRSYNSYAAKKRETIWRTHVENAIAANPWNGSHRSKIIIILNPLDLHGKENPPPVTPVAFGSL
jgi:hypothetical protein